MSNYAVAFTADFRVNALSMARLCALAYTDDPIHDEPGLAEDFPDSCNLTHPTLEGFVCANSEHIVVVFRGTDEPDDWLANMDFAQLPVYDGAVHRGFWLAANQIWSEVLELIERFDNGQQAIWVTGHSLGGALAVLVAKRIADEVRCPEATFTFGAPRVANRAVAAQFEQIRFYRFVNYDDLIPYLPFRFLGPKFYHMGDVNYFTRDGRLVAGKRPWFALLGHGVRAIVLALAWYTVGREQAVELASAGIRDHAITRYIEKLEATVEQLPNSASSESIE